MAKRHDRKPGCCGDERRQSVCCTADIAAAASMEGSFVEHLALHRVSDPRFMAVEVPLAPPRGERRMICPVDSSLEELAARHVLETGQGNRILAGFDDEHAWRSKHRVGGEPSVTYGPGLRADVEARADCNWRPGEAAANRKPHAALVQVMLDASGADEAYIHWLLSDSDCTFVYLVTPPETARHLPEEIEHCGTKVPIRRVPWIRERERGGFDPLATSLWFDIAGPSLALRHAIRAGKSVTFDKTTTRTPRNGEA